MPEGLLRRAFSVYRGNGARKLTLTNSISDIDIRWQGA